MVNDSAQQDEVANLKQALADTRMELLRSQARLHQLQETTIGEQVLMQLRGQYMRSQYELWITKACIAWMKEEPLKMAQCLEASLSCVALEPQVVISDWLRQMDQFARDVQPIVDSRAKMTLVSLLATSEWQALIREVTVNNP
ncbi:MAG: hypothetical protein ACFB0D_13710 [Phormidesmis sp.]